MRLFLFVPNSMQQRCFAPADLERLRVAHELVCARGEEAAELLREWNAHAPQVDAIITGWDTPSITDAMLDQAPRLRLLVHAAGSVKFLLPPSFWQRRIRVVTCNDALAVGVAETTLGMMIAGLKGLFPANALTHAGDWKSAPLVMPGFPVREMFDITVGLIGASKVGRQVIRLLRNFEVSILVADPYLSREEAARLGVQRVRLDELMRQSDIVSLHAPALPMTRHMLGREQFAAMKDHAIFINTARGTIVDEEALAEELKTGRIFAFLDVTSPEPPAADHPFRKLPNVVLTPHIAGAMSNGCRRMGRSAVDQLLLFAQDQHLPGEVTAEQMAILA
jgi:phosphoglycerate dehydrogenase-like enzyme